MSGVWLGQEPCVTGDKAQLSGLTADAVNLGEKAVSEERSVGVEIVVQGGQDALTRIV